MGNYTYSTWSNVIGYEDILNQILDKPQQNTYPPYNIIKTSDDEYLIEIAVAGFSKGDIKVVFEPKDNEIVISGLKDKSEKQYIHHGISGKKFTKIFKVESDVKIQHCKMEDGILAISLKKFVPDELKPKEFYIQ